MKLSDETRRKISMSHKGKILSSEHKKKISEGLKLLGPNKTAFRSGQVPWNKGKTGVQVGLKGRMFSDETKKKMSSAHRGKPSGRKGMKYTEDQIRNAIRVRRMRPLEKEWKGGISKHPKYHSHKTMRYRARKTGNGGFHTVNQWDNLKAQYNWTCPSCKAKEPDIKLTEDHIIPVSKGGSDNIENIQPLCRPCNTRKYTKTIKYELVAEFLPPEKSV